MKSYYIKHKTSCRPQKIPFSIQQATIFKREKEKKKTWQDWETGLKYFYKFPHTAHSHYLLMFHKSTLADLIVLFVLAFFVSVKDYIGLLYQFTFSASKLWWWTCSCPPVLNHQPTEFNFLSHLIIFSVHTSRCIVRPSSARTQRRGEGSGSWLRMHRVHVASENCNSSIFIHPPPTADQQPV